MNIFAICEVIGVIALVLFVPSLAGAIYCWNKATKLFYGHELGDYPWYDILKYNEQELERKRKMEHRVWESKSEMFEQTSIISFVILIVVMVIQVNFG